MMKSTRTLLILAVVSLPVVLLGACIDDDRDLAPGGGCDYEGRTYADQEMFMDDCNSCQCNPEGTVGVACTLVACPPLDTCPTYQPTVGVACDTDKTCDYFIRESYCMPSPDYDIYARCRCEQGIWRCQQDLEDCWVVDCGAPDAMAPKADAGL